MALPISKTTAARLSGTSTWTSSSVIVAALRAEVEVEFFQFVADLLGLLAGEHDEERERVRFEIQAEFAGAPGDERGDLVLPVVAAGVDAVVDLDVGGFFDEFPERRGACPRLGR